MLSGELRRRVLNPYWCSDPLGKTWANARGPAALLTAQTHDYPDVGLFNLLWLMLDTDYKTPQSANDQVMSKYVIAELQKEMLDGVSIKNLAAFYSMHDFANIIKRKGFPGKLRVLASLMQKGMVVT